MASKKKLRKLKSVEAAQQPLGNTSNKSKKYEKELKQNFLVDHLTMAETVIRGFRDERDINKLPTSAHELIEHCEQLVQELTATPFDKLKKQQLTQVVAKLRSMDEIDEEDFRKFHEKYKLQKFFLDYIIYDD